MSITHPGRAPSMRQLRTRGWMVPVITTVGGSASSVLPLVETAPLLPPFGLLMLLAWRLLRPELWQAWAALGLGLADDLLVGHAIGTSMALWTAALLLLDLVDSRIVWRNCWQDWALSACLIATILILSWSLNAAPASPALLPQLGAAILLFPLAQRVVAALDRWRLAL